MEMVFLALWVNGGVAVMPEKYTTEQCKEIQDKNAKGYLLCIPAPKLSYIETRKDGTIIRWCKDDCMKGTLNDK